MAVVDVEMAGDTVYTPRGRPN